MIGIRQVVIVIFACGLLAFLLSVVAGNAMGEVSFIGDKSLGVLDSGGRFVALLSGYALWLYAAYWAYNNIRATMWKVAIFIVCLVFFFEVWGYFVVAYEILYNKKHGNREGVGQA